MQNANTSAVLQTENNGSALVQDCYYVCQWASQNGSSFNGDGSKLAVAGDSCGGNLTIAVSMLAKVDTASAY